MALPQSQTHQYYSIKHTHGINCRSHTYNAQAVVWCIRRCNLVNERNKLQFDHELEEVPWFFSHLLLNDSVCLLLLLRFFIGIIVLCCRFSNEKINQWLSIRRCGPHLTTTKNVRELVSFFFLSLVFSLIQQRERERAAAAPCIKPLCVLLSILIDLLLRI